MSASDPKRTCPDLAALSCHLSSDLRLPRGIRTICAMRRAPRKIVAFLVAVGLTVSGPFASHARTSTSDHATTHEVQAVSHYADLAIDPGQDECPRAPPGTPQSHDDGLCNKCCAACMVASLIPAVPTVAWALLVARDTFLTRDDILVARAVPIEPGIPKPL